MITETELTQMLTEFMRRPVKVTLTDATDNDEADGRAELEVLSNSGHYQNMYTCTFTRGKAIDKLVKDLITYNFDHLKYKLYNE